MMRFSLFFIFTFNSIINVLGYSPFHSQECTFTKTKPNSCLYFVMREDFDHYYAADHCLNEFNGALSVIHESYDEAIEVMQRYYWWYKSDMNVARIRFGMGRRYSNYPYLFDYTHFNPLKHFNMNIDMNIWNRSFPGTKNVTLDVKMYDPNFGQSDTVDNDRDASRNWEYMAVKPKTMKWSIANYGRTIPFVCEVPRFPKIFCESGWRLHMKSRSCFFLDTTELAYTEAAMKCRSLKSNLASINDETENNMVIKMMVEKGGIRAWFGLRHEASRTSAAPPVADKKSREYAKYFALNLGYNVDGTPVSEFNYFGPDQPNGMLYTRENCFLISDMPGHEWHDYNCLTTRARSLCRKMASTERF